MSMVNGEIREGASALNAPKIGLQDVTLDPLEYEKSKTFDHSNLKFENFCQKCF